MTQAAAPISTYRLQIRSSFTLDDAAAITDYLHDLGADWVYFSPLLKAESGSDHGYDVVDHSQVDPDRGGAAGLEAASKAARDHGMGVLVDIVPNHVGVATPKATAWWWDVLKNGRASRYAQAFDIDWDVAGGKVRLPDLGSPDDLSELKLVAADAAVDSGDDSTELPSSALLDSPEGAEVGSSPELELRYYDHRYPVAPGTAALGDDPVAVHARQNYELVHWQRADYDLNYRRFFAVNTLAGIRVEVPEVFAESHAEILRWIREGLADGLRIDHPDGLIDPAGYLERLAEATDGAYVLVEKILEGDEQLPPWRTAGTTGYDALADFDRILVDPAGEEGLDAVDAELRGEPSPDWHEMIHGTKRAVADGILHSEVLRLDRIAEAATDEVSDEAIADAISELLACFPVYRSYLPIGIEHLNEAEALAREHRPDLGAAFDAVLPILSDPEHPAARRFQQTSGMVMAKGVEDQAFYRYTRLTSLTEVGADPAEFGVTADRFHARQVTRHEGWPTAMTTLTTHDTKRSEDTRTRISVLAEIPAEWGSAVAELRRLAPLGDGPLENLLWQAVVGSWPASRERLQDYATKAAREAGDSTSYTEPDEAFESRMAALIDSVFDDDDVAAKVAEVVERVAQPGWSNSLSLKLIQLTAPGVPDVYQGSELWETSLVDPDNRRPVDFAERRALLKRIDDGWLPPVDETGAAKLLVTSRALRLRRDRPELFEGYQALSATGSAADHVVAFDRGGAVTVATRLPIGLAAAGGWGDTTLDVGSAPVRDVLTGRGYPGGELRLSELLATYPVALLIEEGGKQ